MGTRLLAMMWCGLLLAAPAVAQPSPPVLTLADALARARAGSPALTAARLRLDAARAAATLAGRPLNPFIEVRAENWASRMPGGMPLDVFATVTQTVELGGKRGARRDVATAATGTAEAAAAVAWRDLAALITTDYLTALRAREEAAALDAHVSRLAEATRVVASRVAVGTAPEMELLKLRTEEARALVERTRATVAAARAIALLGAALGLDVPTDALRLPAPASPPAVDATLATHPELAAATAAIDAARATLALERSRGVPDVAMNAGWKRTGGYDTGVAAVTVPIPLFDRNHVARAIAAGQLSAAEHDRDAVERRLRGSLVATSAAASTLAVRAADARQVLVEPARQARDAASAAFTAGALDVLRLVDAERLYLDASLVTIALEIEAVGTVIDARRAAGEAPLP